MTIGLNMTIKEQQPSISKNIRLDKVRAHLETIGLKNITNIVHNPSYDTLFAAETDEALTGYEKGTVTDSGAVNVDTGIYTGRSPKDKFLVKDDTTKDTVWWRTADNNNFQIATCMWWMPFVVQIRIPHLMSGLLCKLLGKHTLSKICLFVLQRSSLIILSLILW
jgi:hypothetical protein